MHICCGGTWDSRAALIEPRLRSNAGHTVQHRCGGMPVMTAAVLLLCDCHHSMQPSIACSCAQLHVLHRVC